MLDHQRPLPAVPLVGEILDETGWVQQGLLPVAWQSISAATESSSSRELRGLTSAGLTSAGLAALHREEHAVHSSHQAKWELGWEGSYWDTLRLVPAIPHQPGRDLHS